MSDTEFDEAMVRALRIIAPREHSTLELRRKLRTRGYDTTTIDRVITGLVDQDYLSDDRFADLYVQQRVDRGDGPFKIRNALRKRGISDRISNGLIRNDDEYWLERAQAAHDKKYPVDSQGQLTEWPIARRVRFLRQRGFPTSVIRKVTE